MLSYKEHDNAQAVEIVLSGRISTEEFDRVAGNLEAFIDRHGQVRLLEIVRDFEGMDAAAFGTTSSSACAISRISAASRSCAGRTRIISGRASSRRS